MDEKALFCFRYNLCDKEYIDNMISYLQSEYQEILHFFGIDEIEKTVSVKFWDSIEEFQKFTQKTGALSTEGLVGRAINTSDFCRIDCLSLKELRKCEGHYMSTEEDLKKSLIHEYVHICHQKHSGTSINYPYVSEGLALILSKQFQNKNLEDTSLPSLEEFQGSTASYEEYYILFSYIIENKDHDYILRLASDNTFAREELPALYEEASENLKREGSHIR